MIVMKRIHALVVMFVGVLPGCNGRTLGSPPRTETGDADADGGRDSCPHVRVETRCRDGYCLVPAGCFVMGSPPDEPGHSRYGNDLTEVEYTHSFVVGQQLVTQAEWIARGFTNRAGTKDDGAGGLDCTEPTCPAAMLTWYEAVEYTNKLSDERGLPHCMDVPRNATCTGEPGLQDYDCPRETVNFEPYTACPGFRLPTAGEWEYAARARTTTANYAGPVPEFAVGCIFVPEIDEIAWYCANARRRTHPVGMKKPNAFGLHDMFGNAKEWLAEGGNHWGYSDDPGSGRRFHVVDPPLNKGARNLRTARAVRGGAFWTEPYYLRAAAGAQSLAPGSDIAREPGHGLRVVRTVPAEEVASW